MRRLDLPMIGACARQDELLITCVGQSLSALGYLSPTGPLESLTTLTIAAEITFCDRSFLPCAGSLCVAFDALAIETLATAMMARPQGQAATPGDCADAALELVNVACGDLLPVLFDVRHEFCRSLPALAEVPQVLRRPWIGLRCDSGSIAIRLSLD
jgi:hypothetical protein